MNNTSYTIRMYIQPMYLRTIIHQQQILTINKYVPNITAETFLFPSTLHQEKSHEHKNRKLHWNVP